MSSINKVKAAMRDEIRHEVYLSAALSQRIVAMAKAQKRAKSSLLSEIIDIHLNRRWAAQPDERMFMKLDRVLRLATKTNNETTLVSYCLSNFIRHQLIYAAALPRPGADAIALGEKRYEQFLHRVAKLIARDTWKLDPTVQPSTEETS
jgi:hypothetical protein